LELRIELFHCAQHFRLHLVHFFFEDHLIGFKSFVRGQLFFELCIELIHCAQHIRLHPVHFFFELYLIGLHDFHHLIGYLEIFLQHVDRFGKLCIILTLFLKLGHKFLFSSLQLFDDLHSILQILLQFDHLLRPARDFLFCVSLLLLEVFH